MFCKCKDSHSSVGSIISNLIDKNEYLSKKFDNLNESNWELYKKINLLLAHLGLKIIQEEQTIQEVDKCQPTK